MTRSGRRNTREIEALQNKVRFCRALHRHQEGVIDIAVAVFPEVQDPALGGELPGYANRMIEGCASFRKVQSSRFKVRGIRIRNFSGFTHGPKAHE